MSEPASAQDTAPVGGSGKMFDGIAHRYDLLNRINSLGMDQGWRRATVRALKPEAGGQYLDLATGTADMALELLRQEPSAEVVGLDPSVKMLEVGRTKARRMNRSEQLRLEEGDAEALPFPDASFSGVMMAFGIRNVPDRSRALREMARVLKPGGRAAILELSEPRNGLLAWFARQHVKRIVPLTGALISGPREYKYLRESILAFPEPEAFSRMMKEQGFHRVDVVPFTWGACVLYVGHRE
ncbi:MAG: bifunctional demethylmenaquinone methyltransferase/2-methoxy-6-polyprenyl-1,4-benzoquinol methylase UbiE [Myxococcota bacterium]